MGVVSSFICTRVCMVSKTLLGASMVAHAYLTFCSFLEASVTESNTPSHTTTSFVRTRLFVPRCWIWIQHCSRSRPVKRELWHYLPFKNTSLQTFLYSWKRACRFYLYPSGGNATIEKKPVVPVILQVSPNRFIALCATVLCPEHVLRYFVCIPLHTNKP